MAAAAPVAVAADPTAALRCPTPAPGRADGVTISVISPRAC
jgi:hypothetical protein